MLYVVHIQLRETACDVVDQNIAAAHDAELVGHKALLVVVHNIGDPVYCHRGLPAPGNALHEDVVKGAFPYDLVLFLLDRGDDIAEHGVPVLAQVLYQQLVVCRHIAVIKTLQTPPINVIGAFQVQVNAVFAPFSVTAAVRNAVCSLPDLVFIVHAGDRRPPVHDRHICLVAQDAMLSDVDGLKQPLVHIAVIDPAKKRLVVRRPVVVQLVQAVLLQTPGSHHLVVELDVAALHRVKQFLCLPVPHLVLPLIRLDI